MACAHHKDKSAWLVVIGEQLYLKMSLVNLHDNFAVAESLRVIKQWATFYRIQFHAKLTG